MRLSLYPLASGPRGRLGEPDHRIVCDLDFMGHSFERGTNINEKRICQSAEIEYISTHEKETGIKLLSSIRCRDDEIMRNSTEVF